MSDEVRVTFACGTAASLGRDTDLSSVQCPHCGTHRVRSVAAPAPRIRATDCDARSPLLVKESA